MTVNIILNLTTACATWAYLYHLSQNWTCKDRKARNVCGTM